MSTARTRPLCLALAGACLLMVSSSVLAIGAQEGSSPAQDAALIAGIMQEVAEGWEKAAGAPFERHYLDFEEARYIETGGQNVGLRDLIDNHVVPEGDALSRLALELSNIEVHFEGAFAWAIADVELHATIASDGSSLHRTGYETFLFRWTGSAWKVVHTHSSTRAPRRAQH